MPGDFRVVREVEIFPELTESERNMLQLMAQGVDRAQAIVKACEAGL